jgi:hypothetical protein
MTAAAQVELALERLEQRPVDRRGQDRVGGQGSVARGGGNGFPNRIVASAPKAT